MSFLKILTRFYRDLHAEYGEPPMIEFTVSRDFYAKICVESEALNLSDGGYPQRWRWKNPDAPTMLTFRGHWEIRRAPAADDVIKAAAENLEGGM